jgi:hypothetical protein
MPGTLPENILLYLPSSLPAHIRTLPELNEICQLEQRLREPLADDSLAEVRRQRRVIQGLWHFKRLNASGIGNKPNTRMIKLYKRFDNKTKRAAEKYRAAWRALTVLDPDGSWSHRLKELKDSHISGPGKEADSTSKSRYEPSWIWLVPRVIQSDGGEMALREDEFNGVMRVEWAKARARMKRWNEELLLVQEEMRRVIEYHRWKAEWWRGQSSLREHADASILSGILGYAHKQAAICVCMAERCAIHWLPHLEKKGITPVWGGEYQDLLCKVREACNMSKSDHEECEEGILDIGDIEGDVEDDGNGDVDVEQNLDGEDDDEDFFDIDY